MEKTLGMHFGMLSNSIAKQLKDQGFRYYSKNVKEFQRDLDAILRLWIDGYIPDKLKIKYTERLFKTIEKHVMDVNKLKKVKTRNSKPLNPNS